MKKFLWGLIIILFLFPAAAFAAGPAGGSGLVDMPGSMSPLIKQDGCEKTALLPPDDRIDVSIVLKDTNADRYRSIAAYLQAGGLHVDPRRTGGLVVSAGGSVKDVENVFHTSFYSYKIKGKTFFANDQPARLPAEIRQNVLGVFGLNNVRVMHPLYRLGTVKPTIVRNGQSTPPFTPAEIHSFYGFDQAYSSGLNGSGQTAAVATFASYDDSDLNYFLGNFDISPAHPVEVVPVDGGSGSPDFSDTGGSVETTLDVENLLSSAPACSLLVYEAPATATEQDMVDLFNRIVEDNRAKVVSFSWGEDDNQVTPDFFNAIDTLLAAGAGEGITFLCASGDDGGGYPVYPSTDAHAVSVGGTTLEVDPSTGKLLGVSAWSGSGGGSSAIVPVPAWQLGSGLPVSSGRMTPDISMDGDPQTGYYIYAGGSWLEVGGTSAATPECAAMFVLVDQQRNILGEPPIGQADDELYRLAMSNSYTEVFRPVTSGSNGLYNSVEGYNMATGWGEPLVYPMIEALAGQVQTSRPKPAGYTVLGTDGGIFNFGDSQFSGSVPGLVNAGVIKNPAGAVSLAQCGNGRYWVLNADGGVFTFGNGLAFYGSLPGIGVTGVTPVQIVPAPSGNGYWILCSNGMVYGSNLGCNNAAPIFGNSALGILPAGAKAVGLAPTADGNGYWILASNGQVINFGDAPAPSVHISLAAGSSATSIAAEGNGYLVLGSDGRVYAENGATYYGDPVNTNGLSLAAPAIQIVTTPDGEGYYILGADGGIFTYGDAVFDSSNGGSVPGLVLKGIISNPKPSVALGVTP